MPSDSNDQGKDGQYDAYHAEERLIAYFVDRYVFLLRDNLLGLELAERIELKEDEL